MITLLSAGRKTARIRRFLAVLCAVCLGLSLLSTAALAASAEDIASNINSGIYRLYDIATKVILSVALVAVIIIGFNILTGGDRGMDIARSRAIRVVLAVIIVYLAPLLIENLGGWVTSQSVVSSAILPGWGS